MAKAPEWKQSRKPEPKPQRIVATRGEQTELRVCPACSTAYMGRAQYCSHRCEARSAYRLKVGIPIDAKPYEQRAAA